MMKILEELVGKDIKTIMQEKVIEPEKIPNDLVATIDALNESYPWLSLIVV